MEKIKKALSLILTAVLALNMMSMNVFAASDVTMSSTEIEQVVDEDENEITPDTTEEGSTDESNKENIGSATFSSLNDEVATTSEQSITMGTRPDDGITTSQPYPTNGIAGSTFFRIPAMITLDNGTIVTAADARWNTNMDGGGLDTVVSYSSDNGSTWNYTFANYLGDYGNTHSTSATAFIDPALATDGSTVYMLVDLFPGGYALNGANGQPSKGEVGFTSEGYLKLKKSGESSYNYYLKDGKVYDASGEVDGYTVDAYYNITGTDGTSSNLFYTYDSPYTVYPTNYLYLTKSTDGGKTWSTPTLINAKKSSEQTYLVGPGRGTVLSNGTIIFPCYNYTNGTQVASFVYSTDGGNTWNRSGDAYSVNNGWTSEAVVVELNSTTVRMFYRDGSATLYYSDYTFSNDTWTAGSAVSAGVTVTTNNQLNAIKYNDSTILVSTAASGTSDRNTGKIYTFNLDSSNRMTLGNTYAVNGSNYYGYSCLTKLSNGNAGLLYEPAVSASACQITYTEIEKSELGISETEVTVTEETSGVTATAVGLTSITADVTNVDSVSTDYTAYNVTLNGGDYTSSAKVVVPLTGALQNKAENELTGFVVEANGEITKIAGKKTNDGKSYMFTSPHFSVVGVMAVDTNGETDTIPEEYKGTINRGSGSTKYQLVTNGANGIVSDNEYLIVSSNSGTAYALNSSGSRVRVSISDGTISSLSDSTCVFTFEANGSGYNIKDSAGTYLYPTATRSWGSWSYSLSTNQSSAQAVTVSGTSSVTMSRSVTYIWNSTTSYIRYNNGFSASNNSSNLYIFKRVTEPAGYITDISKLQEQITVASAYTDSSLYTSDSWAVLQEALTAAQGLKSDIYETEEEASTAQDTIDAATYALVQAIAGLKEAPHTIEVTVYEGGTAEYTQLTSDAAITKQPDSNIATVTVSGKNVTISGVKSGTTTAVVGVTTYNITVEERPPYVDIDTTPITVGTSGAKAEGQKVTKLTTSVGVSATLIASGATSWESGDTSIATVDSNGVVKGISAGETTVTAVIDEVPYTIPVVVVEGTGSTSGALYDLYIAETLNTNAYYSINCSSDLVQTQEGEWIYCRLSSTASALDFFAAPEKGYALTFMAAPGSDGKYAALNDKEDPTNTLFYTDSAYAGYGQIEPFGAAVVQAMIKAALDKNPSCDGAMGFTRLNANPVSFICSFRSRKLPTVEKEIISVNGDEYTENMLASEGDVIKYKVTVTQYVTANSDEEDSKEAITFTDPILTDKLSGAVFTDNNSATHSVDLSSGKVSAEKTYSYEVSYTIKDSDLDTDIVNRVDLTYDYSANYSSGSFAGSAEAEALVKAYTFIPKDLVVDFGLPLTVDYNGMATDGSAFTGKLRYNIVSGTATYGDVSVANNSVTYTPNTVLRDVDTVILTNTNGNTFTFKVYPATTVYYEEGFASLEGFTDGSKGSSKQTTQIAGKSSDNYGYDRAYESTGASAGTQATASGEATATFEFAGTGVELYTNNTTDTGNLMAKLYLVNPDGTEKLKKTLFVQTAQKNGDEENITTGQAMSAYNEPVVVLTGLDFGNYKLVVTNSKVDSTTGYKPINIDGFRVFDTLNDNAKGEGNYNSYYKADLEDNPTFIEMRDQVLASLSATLENSDNALYKKEIAGNIYSQIYATGAKNGAVVITNNQQYTNEQLQDLLDNGPKNEIYLQPGQALVFKVNTDRQVQLGMKVVNDQDATYTLNNEKKTLLSSTDMFYDIPTNEEITITNTSSNGAVIGITLLKICDDPNAAFAELTVEDLEEAVGYLYGEGIEEEAPSEPEVTYADATLNISLSDESGNVLGSTALTANGVTGETATFAAADIEAAVAGLVPEGYELKDASYSDVEVVYGETEDVTFTASAKETDNEEVTEPEENPEEKPEQPSNILNQIIKNIRDFFKNLFGK